MKLNSAESTLVRELVDHYRVNQPKLQTFLLDQIRPVLVNSSALGKVVHSFRWRLKDPAHLHNKLCRTLLDAKNTKRRFTITKDNLFVKVNDLVGIRVLHLHTRQ